MLNVGENGLVGQGDLRPSVPLLSRAQMDVTLGNGQLSGTLRPTRNQIALPPFRVTDVGLAVELTPALAANGFVAFQLGSIVTGRVEGGVDGSGLFARGDVEAHVPGLDQATGHIEYRRATGVTGFAVATASRPTGLVRGGEVRIDFAGERWTPSGRIDLMLPGDSPAQLTVSRAGERVVYTGRARLNVRGLHPVDVDLRYDGQHLSGSARTTFELLGAHGDIALRYRDGRFSGNGAVDLTRGRFAGHLDAELHEDGGWTGRGSGSITIRPGLIGTIGLEYGRDRRLKTTGELRFPTYPFLEPRGARRQIFDVHLPDIPIFAISLGIGSVGLVARVGAAMYAGYSFGPGEIRDMVITVTMYPLEDDLDAQLMANARLVLPAELSLEMQFRAGLAASVLIASADGYVTLTGGVRLRGGLDASAQLTYGRGVLTFDAMARIMAGVVLTLDIGALIRIDAPLAGPWEWPFTFGSWSYDTGLQFGLEAPFHYRSDQPLQLPSVSDIHWIVPDLDVGQLADSVASLGPPRHRRLTSQSSTAASVIVTPNSIVRMSVSATTDGGRAVASGTGHLGGVRSDAATHPTPPGLAAAGPPRGPAVSTANLTHRFRCADRRVAEIGVRRTHSDTNCSERSSGAASMKTGQTKRQLRADCVRRAHAALVQSSARMWPSRRR